jgi:hypothetical protein
MPAALAGFFLFAFLAAIPAAFQKPYDEVY